MLHASLFLLRLRLLLLLLPVTAAAQVPGFGALQPYLLLGSEPPWIGAMNGNDYRLSNSSNDADIIYFVAALPGGSAQQLAVGIAVQGHGGARHSGAGLVFDHDPASGAYHAVTLTADGQLSVFRRTAGHFDELTRVPLRGTTAGGTLRLVVRATGQGVDIEANDIHQLSIEGAGLRGQAGLFAVDGGTYLFSDFSVR